MSIITAFFSFLKFLFFAWWLFLKSKTNSNQGNHNRIDAMVITKKVKEQKETVSS